ncbi:RNA polymerase III subunit C11 [Giardia muris]|uniref:DNA-directed RNA polymerase subunit n=1 Tax=Giardia muris TaxID=5742 RepID=A0A4Z1T4R0_GIAMU|nr:RNA polymerase III subunit C11 [Giardia muris]|eukprot:TNJ28983.1 RNA polymerase III subunit C11 [Giardia muris]
MFLCPNCGNLLLTEHDGRICFYCNTCPYRYYLNGRAARGVRLAKKPVDVVLGGDAAWEGADRTENRCPECDHNMAYWVQIQIRSSDEPMSRFYRCCQCGYQWRED